MNFYMITMKSMNKRCCSLNDLTYAHADNVDFLLHVFLDHIRNYRELTPKHIELIRTEFSSEDKMKIIMEYNKVIKTVIDIFTQDEK